jgi:manganese/zinc/iron transport system permease protein
MLAGAALFGLLTTAGIEWLRGRARLQADASVGIVFTGLFALGIILISAYAGPIDLDLDCVLFGEIAYVPLDLWVLPDGRVMGPVPLWLLGGLLLAITALITVAYKPLLLTSFDPMHAAAAGISAAVWHYILMGFVSAATVLSFESVGAILVLSFLTGPPAAAFLLTRRLRPMLLLASGAGVLAAGLGYGLAVLLDGSIAGAMAVVIGAEFALALAWHLYRRRTAPVQVPGETA